MVRVCTFVSFERHSLWHTLFALSVVFYMSSLSAAKAEEKASPKPPSEEELKALLVLVDNSGRGESSHSLIEMRVKTKRYQRSMKMEGWSKGAEYSLIRILEPAKDRGLSTLKVKKNLWNYLPNTDRTMRVPSAMMSGSWMGSHFTNDDVVRETRFSDDYTFSLVPGSQPPGGETVAIRCSPKPKTPVVWGYVDVLVRADGVPIELSFFSEKGVKIRTFSYSDVRDIGGQKVPMKMVVTPHDKPGEMTELIFHSLEINMNLPDNLFSLQSLRD